MKMTHVHRDCDKNYVRLQPTFLFVHLFIVVGALLLKRMCVSLVASNKTISKCTATYFSFDITRIYVTIYIGKERIWDRVVAHFRFYKTKRYGAFCEATVPWGSLGPLCCCEGHSLELAEFKHAKV